MSQSTRAEGRMGDLRGNVLSRLRAHGPLMARLREVDGIDDGDATFDDDDTFSDDQTFPENTLVVPSPFLGGREESVALGVSVVTASSTRENMQERKNMTVQTDLRLTDTTLKRQGLAWHDEVLDEIAAVLTSQTSGWTALGVTGGTPEPLWDEDLNRYRSVQRFDIEHWG